MNTLLDRASFQRELVAWVNERLLPPGASVDVDTPLFADGLINSIRILELIAWTERATGSVIPDRMILMDHFRTVRRISEVFSIEGEVVVTAEDGVS